MKIFLLAVLLIIQSQALALAPVESLVLGDFSADYSENKTDPLNYVFNGSLNTLKNNSSSLKNYKRSLALYRGFYEEGKNLANYCSVPRDIRYGVEWEKTQVKRSLMSIIQYVALDLSTRAIPQYAKALEFSKEEYQNMVEGLVGNYCSNNLSVISKKELLKNFNLKFDKENTFSLPSVKDNPFFPENIESYFSPIKKMEQELQFTVKIFQAACSWSGNPSNPGLMVPILKHSALMAFFIRQMNNQAIEWKELDNSVFLKEDKNTIQVWCENLICRKTDSENFYNKVYYSIGGTNVSEDLRRLYCEEFTETDYRPKENDDRLAQMMKQTSFDDENLMNSQFIALITGVPDFLVGAEKFADAENILRSSVDDTWNKWAKKSNENFNSDLYFEEPLTLELVDREQYENFRSSEFKVVLDVNLGEFDRINQIAGKVKVSFGIKVPSSFLRYYQEQMRNLEFGKKDEEKRLINRFKQYLVKDLARARDKFLLPPWKGDLEGLLAEELTGQMKERPERYLRFDQGKDYEFKIEINYGVFALKYLNHQYNVRKNLKKSP